MIPYSRQSIRLAIYSLLLIAILVIPSQLNARLAINDTPDAQDKIDSLVLTQLATEGTTDFFVVMTEKADLSPAYELKTKEEKGQFVFDTLTATADRSQADLLKTLDEQGISYRSFYIANKVYVLEGNTELVMSLASRDDIAKIVPNYPFQLPEPIAPNPNAPEAVESNIAFVNADDVWALGHTGEGMVVAGNDTGIDWDHPGLINQYRGWNGSTADHNYNWWDATGDYPTAPGDGDSHGTHTTGTMVGDDGAGNQVGMAPGAKMIHCKNIADDGSGGSVTFIECFQWDLAPWDLSGNNPDPSMAPDAINNSWGWPVGGGDPQYEDEIAALRAAGIVVEVSAGNEGPNCATLRTPGDYDQSLTTGSVNHAGGTLPGTITGFSSRGASVLYPNEFIPDIMAPGENIRSTVPGGGYSSFSGTSMSGPHVTGLIALMWSASPNLRGDVATTEQIIMDTAVPLTGQGGSSCGGDYTEGPNNDWGHGTIDALAAVEEAIRQGGPFGFDTTPDSQSICAPANAIYSIEVLLNDPNFTDPITLASVGEPAGTLVDFTPNIQAAPFTSTFTISNTGSATVGSYDISVLGIAPTSTQTTTVSLLLADAIPGNIDLVSPANGATNVNNLPTFDWDESTQAETYLLEVATDMSFTNVVYSATTDSTMIALSGGDELSTLTTHYWRVTASNACGTGASSAVYSFVTEPAPGDCAIGDGPNIVYSEGFENGDGGWTHGSNAGPDTWTLSTANPYNGSTAFHADDVGQISDQYLVSPEITLPTGQAPLTFQFWNYQELEDGGAGCYDGSILEISTDGGSNWTYLDDELLTDPYDGAIDGGFNNPLIGYDAWCGDPQAYLNSIVDIDAYAGESVHFRFRLGTDSSVSHPGWDIDDVKVQSCQSLNYAVEIGPDQTETVMNGTTLTYTLLVSNTGILTDTYDITLSDNSWSSTPSVSSISLEAGNDATLEVVVEVPEDALGGTSDTVLITATSQNSGSTMASASLTTNVEVVYEAITHAMEVELSGKPDTTLTYTLWLTNSGNMSDTFDVTASSTWTTTMSTTSMTMGPHHTSQSMEVMVHVPADAEAYASDTITVTVTAQSGSVYEVVLTAVAEPTGYLIYLPFITATP